MLRKAACAMLVLGIGITFALAEEIPGTIQRVADGKVTILPKKGKKGDEKTYDLAKEVKVSLKEGKETKEVAGGLKSDLISGIAPEKGKTKAGTIVTNADGKVTEIIVNAPKK